MNRHIIWFNDYLSVSLDKLDNETVITFTIVTGDSSSSLTLDETKDIIAILQTLDDTDIRS